MSKGSAPTPAPPQQVAGEQTKSNVSTAVANATLGNVNQYSPYGSTTYQETGGKWVDGNWVPSYSQTTALNPTLQNILTGTENTAASLIPTGQALADQAGSSLTNPLNVGGVNNDIIQGGPQAINSQATKAAYDAQAGFLDPQWGEKERQLQNQLSRQGVPLGSEAYNNAMTNYNNSKTQAYQEAQNNAVLQGQQGGSNMFNLALLGQQQNLNQQQLGQTNALNNLRQIYSVAA